MSAPIYRRVLLKVSGEALMGSQAFGIDIATVDRIAADVRDATLAGTQVCMVIGGGNIFRGVSAAAKGIDRAQADYMGMLATVMNALAMQAALAALNRELAAEGGPTLDFGIGINTARVVAGNMGSRRRLNYSVVGDGVNVAARLEALTRTPEYRATILASEATLRAAQGHYTTRPLGPITVRGRAEPVQVHAKPRLARQPIAVPQFGDEFDTAPNMAWQWNSNPMEDWIDASAPKGVLRLKSISSSANLYEAGNLLTQKLAGYAFTATAKLTFAPRAVGERTGLLMFGYNYGWIGLEKYVGAVRLVQVTRMKANTYAPENVTVGPPVAVGVVYLRLTAAPIVTPACSRRSMN